MNFYLKYIKNPQISTIIKQSNFKMDKRLRYFTKEDIWMADKLMKRHSVSLTIKEYKLKSQ